MKMLDVNNTRIACLDHGQGSPVLLVHGFPLDYRMWEGQIETLAVHYRVIVPDLRGFGQSGVGAEPVTMEQFADDLAALLDSLGVDEPVVLCGLSMGGYVALAFAASYAARLRGLVLCDTRAAADTPEAADAREAVAQQVLREGPGKLADTMVEKLLAPFSARLRPKLPRFVRDMVLACEPQGIASAARGMAQRRDSTPLLGAIDCPTLVAVGAHDALSPPEEMRALARAIPQATLVEIPDAGHLSPLENPGAFNQALLDFLDRLPPVAA